MLPNKDKLKWMFTTMAKIRAFEERSSDLFLRGVLPGFLHSYIGEEAVATGVCAHLSVKDVITSTHRGHGHVIAKGARLDKMFAELYAKRTGYCKGKGGSMHIADLDLGILGANGIVGAGIPIAAGAAVAFRLRKEPHVAVAFFGDGGSNTGAFHEGTNLAATWNLPVILVCENNEYAESTPRSVHQKIKNISERAKAYDIPGVIVDGQDVLAVYDVAGEAIQRARSGQGPTLIEAKTYRYTGHYVGDSGTLYRTREEVEERRKRDPIALFRQKLLADKSFSEQELQTIEAEVARELDEAVRFGEESPEPELEDALTDVFSE
jgi:pyruvate dehydrogenase E1 component alpha subunit